MIDQTRNIAANASQAVQSHFAQDLRRVRIVNRAPSELRTFSLTVPSGLNRRKLYAFVDCQTALDSATFYWWFRSTVTALARGVALQSWPLEIGMFNDSGSGFVDYATSAFPHGAEASPDCLRLMCKNGMNSIPMPRMIHPVVINLDCDQIRWDFVGVNPAYLNQSILQARVFLACRSEQ